MRYTIKQSLRALLGIAAVLCMASCDSIEDDRIPESVVRIDLSVAGQWDVYGVHAVPDYRRFIRQNREPANFPYTDLTYTGYGGVLLVADINGVPQAYDLSCPVEARRDVRISVDTEKLQAVCDKCGSRYDIFSNYGYPISGQATTMKYGLKHYQVLPKNYGYLIAN